MKGDIRPVATLTPISSMASAAAATSWPAIFRRASNFQMSSARPVKVMAIIPSTTENGTGGSESRSEPAKSALTMMPTKTPTKTPTPPR